MEFVSYIETRKGKKLLKVFKSKRAVDMFLKKNTDKILSKSGIESVGSMSKRDWDSKEAKYAINEVGKGSNWAEKYVNDTNLYKKLNWYMKMGKGVEKKIKGKEFVIMSDGSALIWNAKTSDWELYKPKRIDKKTGKPIYESVNEAAITYGIEYKSSKKDRKFKKASLTKTTHNPNIDKMMIKAISKDAKSLAKQDGWVDYRITKDGVPVKESVNEGKKRYYQKDGIGKSKYTISYHDGKKKHKDGSDFFDIQIFRNKKDLAKFVNSLHKGGYVYGFGESVKESSKYRHLYYTNEDKKQIKDLVKKVKHEKLFYDVLDTMEKKYGKRKYRIWLEKSLRDFGLNPKHYDYRTNAAAEEKLFQLGK